MFKTVLFPIDQSREAREAASVVVDLVKKYSSRLVLLSVVEPSSSPQETSGGAMSNEAAVAKLLDGAKQIFAQEGINAETMEREGQPPFIICDVADEIDANLIIMGCRGIGLTEEGATESVTNRVINLAPCPVLIVP